MTLKGRRPEVRKSKHFIFKVWGYMFFTAVVTWSFSRYIVNYYNPDAYPNVSMVKIVIDFWKELGAAGIIGLLTPAILEIFRRRT